MRVITIISAALLSAGIIASASAADLPRKAPAYVAPAYVAPIGYNWTGFYVGVNAGYGWANLTDSGGLSARPRGFIGGAQIGYNWQAAGSPFVFGLEADFQGSAERESASGVLPVLGATTVTDRIRYFGTVRGRLGYAWDRSLFYATGGYAYQNVGVDVTTAAFGSASANTTKSGYALGAGWEYAFAGPWTGRIEYVYLDSGTQDITLGGTTFSGRIRNNILRAGLNYRF